MVETKTMTLVVEWHDKLRGDGYSGFIEQYRVGPEDGDYCCDAMSRFVGEYGLAEHCFEEGVLYTPFDERGDQYARFRMDFCPGCGARIVVRVVKHTREVRKTRTKQVVEEYKEVEEVPLG